jgi:peptide chain release factor 3
MPIGQEAKLREEVEMAKGLCPPFDPLAYCEGHLTPVYFGSGAQQFRGARIAARGRRVGPGAAPAAGRAPPDEPHFLSVGQMQPR